MRKAPLLLLLLATAARAGASTPPKKPARAARSHPHVSDGLTASQIVGVMNGLRPEVDRCFEKHDRADLVILQIVIASTGAVFSAHVAGALEDTPTGVCIELAAADVVFPQFSGPPRTISFPFRPSP